MANAGPAYGLSREVKMKIDKKYDSEMEEKLVKWILIQCPKFEKPQPGKTEFQTWLKDGLVSVFLSCFGKWVDLHFVECAEMISVRLFAPRCCVNSSTACTEPISQLKRSTLPAWHSSRWRIYQSFSKPQRNMASNNLTCFRLWTSLRVRQLAEALWALGKTAPGLLMQDCCLSSGKDLAAVQRTLMNLGSMAVTKMDGNYKGEPEWFHR